MRISLLGLTMLFCAGAANAQSNIKLFGALNGNHELSFQGESQGFDTKDGLGIGLELMKPVHSVLDLGAGLAYQFPRGLKDAPSAKFSFIPLYALARFHGQAPLYGKISLGYNFFTGNSDYKGGTDLSGGVYWGASVGYAFGKILIEAGYCQNTGELSAGGISADITQSQLLLGLGIAFH